ncbi:hypothetical protein H0E87_024257 [Populus deltoides]|uniref:Uncharacterized protein n=1 Tax=Populus deltoides TaxID=3696 RepID=A0A8T2X931_POPDE|nr:hypothetical protein H0E87_024257 [Populus deltoides]
MEDQEEQQDNTSDQNHKPQDLPQVLLLKPPPVLSVIGEQPFLSKKYQFLKAWESPLPLIQFLTAHADSIQAILCSGAAPVTDDLLQLLPSVRLVVTASAGTNHIDLEACHRRGISVTNAGNVFSDDGADAAVGLLIDVLRKITASDRYVRQGLWVNKGDYPLGSKLRGKRVGIVGLGGIGLEIAKRLEAFGCNVFNIIRLLPSLSLIVTTSARLNQIDLQEGRRRGISVAYDGSLFSEDDADIALGGKKVGIVGLGSIGQEAAKGLENYGCNILYNSRTKKSSVPYPCYSNV